MPRRRPWQVLGAWVMVSVLLGGLAPAWAQSPRQETLQSNAAATGNGTQVTTLGYSLAAVQIVGTGFTGTLSFEASVDGTTYTAVMCTSMADTATTSTTATGSGTWFCPIAGAQKFQARLSSYSAGSVTVKATLMPNVSRPPAAAGGGGTVTSITGGTCLSGGAISSSGTLSVTPDCIGPTQIDETANYTWSGTDRFTGTFSVPHSTSLPGTCTVGDAYMDTDATSGARWYLCESSNTWAAQGGAGSVTGSGTTGTIPVWASSSSLGDSGLTDNGSVLTVNRGYRGKVAAKSADYTLTTADYQIDCTAGSGGITLTLPSASGLTGQHYRIYKVDTDVGACTVSPNGSDLLNGVNGAVTSLTTPYAGLDITQVSATAWTVVSLGPLAIGDSVTSGTAGSLLYVGTGSVLAQDNANLFYDATNQVLGLGIADPANVASVSYKASSTVKLALASDDGSWSDLVQVLAGGNTGSFVRAVSRGTFASRTASQTGDYISYDLTKAYDGTNYALGAYASTVIDGTVATGKLPVRYVWATANSGDGVTYERLWVTSQGTTGVDGTACAANGSTHCLAGAVEAQKSLTVGNGQALLSSYTVASTTFSLSTLTGGATTVTLGDDAVSSQITIPFNFQFWGDVRTHVYIASNGFIVFEANDGGTQSTAETLPDRSSPNGIVAAYWTDLDPSSNGTVKYQTLGTTPNRIFVVQFDQVGRCCAASPDVSFQIKLFETSNNIEVHSASADNHGDASVTQGVESFSSINVIRGITRAVVPSGRNHANFTLTNDAVRFTPGFIPFVPDTGALHAASAYVDSYLAIGTQYTSALDFIAEGLSPTLLISGGQATAVLVSTSSSGGAGAAGNVQFLKRRGSDTLPLSSQSGDVIGEIIFSPYDAASGAIAGIAITGEQTDSSFNAKLFLGSVGGSGMSITHTGHVHAGTTTPAVSNTSANSCGTSAASIVGSDHAGKVTVGATAGTSCTVTFANAFTTVPSCTVTNETTANLVRATSTTSTVILAGTMVAADKLAYVCLGY